MLTADMTELKYIRRVIMIVSIVILVSFCFIGLESATALTVDDSGRYTDTAIIDLHNGTIQATIDPKEPEFVPGELIVKFKSNVSVKPSISTKGIVTIGYPSIDTLNEEYGVTSLEKVFETAEKTFTEERPDLSNIYIFELPKDADILSIAEVYQKDPNVEYAEPNYISQICVTPNDPCYPQQWAHQNMQSEQAWDIETGDPSVAIAIVDTGVDWDHPDLAANIWINLDEIPDNGIDDDNNGYIDDVRGWDFVNYDSDPMDDNGHGTHCSGIAAAETDNGVGVAGVCWICAIMALKGLDVYGSGGSSDLAIGIQYAADNGVDVISMSWGSYSYSNLMKDAVDYAYGHGVVLVGAAGNDNINKVSYPAGYSNVIAVSATDSTDSKASFIIGGSNYGSWIDVAAPGVSIYSTMPTYQVYLYAYLNGTSMSTPYVAGLAGLILSKNPIFSNEEVRNILRSTADPVISTEYIGLGRINAYNAILRNSTLIANLDSSQDDAFVQDVISINGTASGNNFHKYELYYGLGVYPTDWTQIGSTQYTQVVDGVLATWNTSLIIDGTHSIRLEAMDVEGQVTEDRVVLRIDNSLHEGWPKSLKMTVGTPPIVADLDADGKKEIIVSTSINGDMNEEIYVFRENGELIEGWPKFVDAFTTEITVGDINNEGNLEIVLSTNKQIFAWNYNGSSLSGWPKWLGDAGHMLNDINDDGYLEIIQTADGDVHVLDYKGNELPGWPVDVGTFARSPVVGDVDSDGDKEIVVVSKYWDGEKIKHTISVLSSDGNIENGWPKIITGVQFNNPPEAIALGDIDGDGTLEIVLGDGQRLYVWKGDGTSPSGWPIERSIDFVYPPVIGDLDGDNKVEILEAQITLSPFVFGANLTAYNHDGTIVDGFPITVAGSDKIFTSSPIIADLDNDGNEEILISSKSRLWAFNHDGALREGWPLFIRDFSPNINIVASLSPAIEDIDNDERLEVIVVSNSGSIYIWDLKTNYGGLSWPMFQHDMWHTGIYGFALLATPPKITAFAPPSPVNDTICNWRRFNVTVNQTVDVSWYLNDTLLFTNESVWEAKYTFHAAVVGDHNVTASASNANGTDLQIWIWNVTEQPTCDGTNTSCGIYPNCENCNEYDGCYVYGNGCEERDYYCKSNEEGCNYTYSNRHTDYYDDFVYYCKGDEVWKRRLLHNLSCDNGSCIDHTSWVDDQLVDNCNDHDGWYCKGDLRVDIREYRDYKCSKGSCAYTIISSENCTDLNGCYAYENGCEDRDYYCSGGACEYIYSNRRTDGWEDTGNTRWVDDPGNECKEKAQKEQEYRDYKCSDDVCTYTITDTQWLDTGNTRNKADGTICNCTADNTLKTCYEGNCTDTGICNTTICGADAACDGKKPEEACGAGRICNSICNCVFVAIEPPEISSYAPESPVNDSEGATRTFNVTINQTVNVSWQINGTVVQTNASVTEAAYTNLSAVVGTWNVSVIVNNVNGTDMQMWVWTVTSPCFIATAAYGTPLHEDIDVLRDFRDEYLMTNLPGRAFVKIYYYSSPPLADAIRANECLGTAVRDGFVKPIVHISRMFVLWTDKSRSFFDANANLRSTPYRFYMAHI